MGALNYVDRQLANGVAKPRFSINPDGNSGYSFIEIDESQLASTGTNFGKLNAMNDMVLGCDVEVSESTVTISHPNGIPAHIWFEAPKDYIAGDNYVFKHGDNSLYDMMFVNSQQNPLGNDAFKEGSIVIADLKTVATGIQAFVNTTPTGAGTGDMTKVEYDPDGSIAEAGGIAPYVVLATANLRNFNVVSGSAPPAEAPEGTIFVPMAFSVVSYSKARPVRPVANELWIPEGIFQVRSQTAIDTLLSVGEPSLYAGQSWQIISNTQIMEGGVWKPLNGVLYDSGNTPIEWEAFHTSNGGTAGDDGSVLFAKTEVGWSGSSPTATVGSAETIYVGSAERLEVHVQSFTQTISSGSAVIGLRTTKNAPTTADWVVSTSTIASGQTVVLDVSTLMGSYYFAAWVNVSGSTNDYKRLHISKVELK